MCLFGNAGPGKTHLAAAECPELVLRGRSVLVALVAAKRGLRLEREPNRLDRFEAVVLITSNLVFSPRDRIFGDATSAAAAIDRVMHHSVIPEPTIPSPRAEAARARGGESGDEGNTMNGAGV